MANHKSSIKRIRQTESRRLRNRYYAKTARNAVRNLRKLTDKTEAAAKLRVVSAMLDRLASKKAISKNKASNLKSKLALYVNKLGSEAFLRVVRVYGPFVYRLGRKIFILERAVRFCYGLRKSPGSRGFFVSIVEPLSAHGFHGFTL